MNTYLQMGLINNHHKHKQLILQLIRMCMDQRLHLNYLNTIQALFNQMMGIIEVYFFYNPLKIQPEFDNTVYICMN